MLSNQTKQQLKAWQALLLEGRCRGLVHIQGDRQWALNEAQSIGKLLAREQVSVPEQGHALDYNQLKTRLGSEAELVIFDSFSGFHANAFALIAGTLVSGGILILISPESEHWPNYADPDLKRFSSIYTAKTEYSYFLQRLQLMLSKFPAVILRQDYDAPVFPCADKKAVTTLKVSYVEQEELVEKIKKVATGHAKRPLLITADRGRGKSAALGLAARGLLQQRQYNIIVTAPAKPSLASFYRHLGDEYQEVVSFYPVDEIVRMRPEADLLIIDEAASIPSAILTEFISHYNRLVFSTTVHGYEGNGQGFMLRFSKTLSEKMPGWKKATLNQPIRYAPDDPLESLVNRLFVFDGECNEVENVETTDIHYEYIEQQRLAEDEELLIQVFTLLITSHYQTSADDLRALLDMQGLKIFVAKYENNLVGVLLVVLEGGFSKEAEQALFQSPRRFRGHLLPQQCYSAGLLKALPLRFARVMRIAVPSKLRRLKIGAELLRTAENMLSVDCIGASFALDAGVLRFWQQSHFTAVSLGSRKESSSGAYSAVVLKGLSAEGSQLERLARVQFGQSLPYQLLTHNSDLNAGLAGLLLYQLDSCVDERPLGKELIERYCQNQIGLEQVQPFLAQELIQIMAKDYYQVSEACNICIAVLLQGQSFAQIAKSYGLTGRKAVEAQIKQYFTTIKGR